MKILFFTLFITLTLNAQMLEVSQKLETKELISQHGTKHKLIKSGIWVIAWDKETTRLANTYFKKHQMRDDVNLIVDTSEIPSGIFSLFVHPRMKKFKHKILFSFKADYNRKLPYKEDYLTLLYIKDSLITKIDFLKTLNALEESLK